MHKKFYIKKSQQTDKYMFMYKNQHTFSYINCKLMLLVLEPKFAAYLWEYKTIIYRTLLIIINKDYSKLI